MENADRTSTAATVVWPTADDWYSRPDNWWTFRAQRIKGANGLWYRLECRCFVCRQRDGRLCNYIVDFIRAQPKYANFEMVRDDD